MNLKALLVKKASLEASIKTLVESASEDGFTDEQASEFETLSADLKRTETGITAAKAVQAAADAETATEGLSDELGDVITGGRNSREDDPTYGFSDMSDFAMSVFNAFNPAGQVRDERLEFIAAVSGMSQGSGPDGGFLVPPTFSQNIWDDMQNASDNLLQYCDTYTVTGESLTFPAIDESSRAAGSRWGGVRGYWLAEGDQMTKSKTKLRKMKLEPQQLGVLVYVTDKLLNNAPAMRQFITRAAADEINFQVGDAIINGNGVGKPKGILISPSTISVAKETSQAADTILAENIDKMTARLHPRAAARAIWLHNHDCLPQLKNLYYPVKNVAGSENVGGFAPAMYDRKDKTLDGLKTVDCEYCATVGDAGDLVLADLGSYAVGIKGSVKSDISIHLRFDYNETAFRFIYEIDGQPWLNSPITPYKGSNTLSTSVKLAARA